MDFDDLIISVPPPKGRVGKAGGDREHHLYEGAVMLAYAMHLLCIHSDEEVRIRPSTGLFVNLKRAFAKRYAGPNLRSVVRAHVTGCPSLIALAETKFGLEAPAWTGLSQLDRVAERPNRLLGRSAIRSRLISSKLVMIIVRGTCRGYP